MNKDVESTRLTEYAEAVVRELRRHAALLDSSSGPGEIIPAVNSLRAAAREYVRAVQAGTGWGNVFDDLEGEENEESQEEGSSEISNAHKAPVVTYREQYKLRVHDFEGARKLLKVRSRLGNAANCEDYNESYTGIVGGLAEVDGWRPQDYDQTVIEVISNDWESLLEG
jgi:hypothetical protein